MNGRRADARLRGWQGILAGALATAVVAYWITAWRYAGYTLVREHDAEDILLPLFLTISRAIGRDGLLAGMYDPGVLGGLTYWNFPGFHPLYPFYFNWLGGDHTVFDTWVRLNLVQYLHRAIYAAGGFLLCRSLGVRPLLAFATGLAMAWLPAVDSAAGWPQVMAAFAWLPWIMACQVGICRADSNAQRACLAIALGICASLLVLAQPAQNLVLAVVGSAVFWACLGWVAMASPERRPALRQWWLDARWLLLSLALALAFTGEYLFEVLRFHRSAIRWLGEGGGHVIGDQRLPLASLKLYALPIRDVVSLAIYDRAFTRIIGNLYIGGALLVCVAWAVLRPGSTMARALLSSALVAIVFCFGFFAPILQFLPIANKVREVNWWACYAVTVLLPLAALGLEALMASPPARWRPRALALPAALFAVCWLLAAMSAQPWLNRGALLLGFGLLSLLAVFAARVRIAPLFAAALVLASVAIPATSYTRVPANRSLIARADHVRVRADIERLAHLLPDEEDYRVSISPQVKDFKLEAHMAGAYGMRAIRGDISPMSYPKFQLLYFPTKTVAELFGIKYEVVPDERRSPGDLALGDGLSVKVDRAALPRAFLLEGGLALVDSPVNALLSAPPGQGLRFYARRKDLPDGANIAELTRGSPMIVPLHLLEDTSTRLKITGVAQPGSVLVLNEDPGARWSAELADGREVDAFPLNGFQTGFVIGRSGPFTLEIRRPTTLF